MTRSPCVGWRRAPRTTRSTPGPAPHQKPLSATRCPRRHGRCSVPSAGCRLGAGGARPQPGCAGPRWGGFRAPGCGGQPTWPPVTPGHVRSRRRALERVQSPVPGLRLARSRTPEGPCRPDLGPREASICSSAACICSSVPRSQVWPGRRTPTARGGQSSHATCPATTGGGIGSPSAYLWLGTGAIQLHLSVDGTFQGAAGRDSHFRQSPHLSQHHRGWHLTRSGSCGRRQTSAGVPVLDVGQGAGHGE